MNTIEPRVILVNAFSLNMIDSDMLTRVRICPVEPRFRRQFTVNGNILTINRCAVGHKETAHLLTERLGFNVGCTRSTIRLGGNDTLIVAQYRGSRLPIGTTELPEDGCIEFSAVYFVPKYVSVYNAGNYTIHTTNSDGSYGEPAEEYAHLKVRADSPSRIADATLHLNAIREIND